MKNDKKSDLSITHGFVPKKIVIGRYLILTRESPSDLTFGSAMTHISLLYNRLERELHVPIARRENFGDDRQIVQPPNTLAMTEIAFELLMWLTTAYAFTEEDHSNDDKTVLLLSDVQQWNPSFWTALMMYGSAPPSDYVGRFLGSRGFIPTGSALMETIDFLKDVNSYPFSPSLTDMLAQSLIIQLRDLKLGDLISATRDPIVKTLKPDAKIKTN